MKSPNIVIMFFLLISLGCSSKNTAPSEQNIASAKEEKKDSVEPAQPPPPPGPPKRVSTPILMSPLDVFGAEKLLHEPFELFPYAKFVSNDYRRPVGVSEYDPDLVKKLTGKWIGYWKAKTSFTEKNPLAADLENYRVYFQFKSDMTWNAIWLSKFEPSHPSYASLSGKYSFKFPKMILSVDALRVNQGWSSNEGDLGDLKFVCDSCNWQDANDLVIELKFEDDDSMIFFDAGSEKRGYSERIYLVRK
ncbi:MAG: hypothetical protein WCK49_02360 [Myxococcaceae bacterium]